jgi:polyisoprenoid-binding protein YceI
MNSIQNSQTRWNIDPTHSSVDFAVRHLMIATVRGRFAGVGGYVELDDSRTKLSKVAVNIDVASIDTRQEQRDAHLRSADFFDAEKYPTITFESTGTQGDLQGEFTLQGRLTMHGVTKDVTLEVESNGLVADPWGNQRAGFTAKGKLNRSDFGLSWNQVLEAGGVVVGEEIKISIDLELVRQAADQAKAA